MRVMNWNKGERELPICARSFQANFKGCKDDGKRFKLLRREAQQHALSN
jgi:hypothetical protein